MLRYKIIDVTPYYDIKTGTIHGGVKFSFFNNNPTNRIVKIAYYKCRLDRNPFRFFKFSKSSYMKKKIGILYKTGNLVSLFTKKI